MSKMFVMLFLSILVASCAYRSPPLSHQAWDRKNTSYLEKKNSMLECGYTSPDYASKEFSITELIKIHLCMEEKGFIYDGGDVCKIKRFKDFQICKDEKLKKKKLVYR